MKDITLVILAAGMGSRFGGLKQIEPLGPNKEFIIDYSIYDAIKAGFTKVVFIIKKENYEIFKETIGKRVEPHIKVQYCFQENNNIPDGYEIPVDRVKPLGTAHAILCAKKYVDGNFAIINADDYYGYDAFSKACQFLKNNPHNYYGVIAYEIGKSIPESGAVKRAICKEEDGFLTQIKESSVYKENGKIHYQIIGSSKTSIATNDELVSLNLLLFTPQIFKDIQDGFIDVLEKNKNDLTTFEYLIPDVVMDDIKNHKNKVAVIRTTSTWYGVTYKEDKDSVSKSLAHLHEDGTYPKQLW